MPVSSRDDQSAASAQVFVSYSRRDFYFAEQLAVALRRHDVAAWFDVHELTAGTDWSAAIDRAIGDCEALVLVASRSALGSAQVRSELDRALQRGRPVVAVRCSRATPPPSRSFPIYDLRRAFERGVATLADDLRCRRTSDRRRLLLPLAFGPFLVALAPALTLLSGVVLGTAFLQAVLGHTLAIGRTAAVALVAAMTMLGMLIGVATYTLVALVRRTISWRYLRGAILTMPLLALAGAVELSVIAAFLTDPLAVALGSADGLTLGVAPILLALLVVPGCVAAGLATEFSAGLCRVLRTGVAPQRIRARHLGVVWSPPAHREPARRFRIHATGIDGAVASQLGRSLLAAGAVTVTDPENRDRDVVIVSDGTPSDWLTRGDLADPMAVVATSIGSSLDGALGRFQWVDYRRRRARTLRLLAEQLIGPERPRAPRAGLVMEVPERLQLLRLPTWVAVTEWMLFCLGVIAAQVGAYAWTRVALDGWDDLAWLPGLCVLVSPMPFLLAHWLRRRRITVAGLVAAIAAFWVVVTALGADTVFQVLYPFYDRGPYSTVTILYPVLSALILGVAARSLIGWLRGVRGRTLASLGGVPVVSSSSTSSSTGGGVQTATTLGAVRGSWVWLAIMLPALGTAVGTALLQS